MATRLIEQWFKGGTELEKEGWPLRLEERLDDLERILGEWYQTLRFGPVPGGYVDFHFRAHNRGGIQAGALVPQDVIGLPEVQQTTTELDSYEIRPIFLSASIYGDVPAPPSPTSLDMQIKFVDGATGLLVDVLTTPLTVDESAFAFRLERGRGDFAVDRILSDLMFLEVSTINDGTPQTLSVHMICNQSASVER